jgi:hypothetical protein
VHVRPLTAFMKPVSRTAFGRAAGRPWAASQPEQGCCADARLCKAVSRFVVVRNPPPETLNVPVEVTSLMIGRDHSWLRLKPSSSQPVIPRSISFMGRPPGSDT